MQISLLSQAPSPADSVALNALLIETVAGGGSIGFMHPVTPQHAEAFWRGIAAAVQAGERAWLVARDAASEIIGTVQIVLAQPPNQPHRADIAKLMVHPRARQQGVAAALIQAVEAYGVKAGKTLLCLDTVTGDSAERLYTRLGWQSSGEIPHYALRPHGGLCSTTIMYKLLGD